MGEEAREKIEKEHMHVIRLEIYTANGKRG
jgi:hypothetical protein